MKFFTPALVKLAICAALYGHDAAAINAVVTNVEGATGLWSDPSMWVGNIVPEVGDDVVISGMGSKITLDVLDPPLLNSITVKMDATLEVSDPTPGSQMTLELYHLHVLHHASFTLGTPDNRIQGNVLIRLHGDASTPVLDTDHPSSGSKVLFNHNGNVDMHGAERSHTWTRLAATAYAGDALLRVRGWVDWKIGEKIAITSADFDVEGFDEQFEAQEVMITQAIHETSDAGKPETVITMSEPMAYSHFGDIQCWNDDDGEEFCVDTVAEVALLSRNIVVEGHMDASSVAASFGGQMKFHNSDYGLSRISYIEARDMGQLGVLGSYPIHFHVPGNSEGSFAIGNSIHRSFNRAITIHGAQGIYVGNNVVYDTFGHAIYLEDGTEMGNTIEGNLVFNTHAQEEDLLDAEDGTPASYWISNPNNTIISNVAGGGRYAGFWIVPEKNLDVGSDLCPRHLPLGEFRDNVAHSYFKYGIEATRWLPKKAGSPCSDDSEDEPAVLLNNTVFKCGYNGVRFVGSSGGCGAITLDGLVAVDNARTYHTSAAVYWGSVSDSVQQTGTVGVRNAIFIQWSNNNPFSRIPLTAPVRAALKFPDNSDNVFVESSTFVNYYQEGWVFDPERQSAQNDAHKNGFEIPVRDLKFINSPNRVHFRFPHHGIIIDRDGSITGSPSRIVPASPLYDMNRCSAAPPHIATTLTNDATRNEYDIMFHSVDLLVCDYDYTLRRLGRGEFVDGDDEMALQTYENGGNEEAVVGYGSQGRYTVVAPTNTTIHVRFDRGYSPREWSQQLSRRYMEYQEFIHFVFHPPASKAFATFNVEFDGSHAPADAVWTEEGALHVVFEVANIIELKGLTYVDTAPTTSPPSKAPSTANPTALPTKQPTSAPTFIALGQPCTRGSDCGSGICASNGADEVVCVVSDLFCR